MVFAQAPFFCQMWHKRFIHLSHSHGYSSDDKKHPRERARR